MFRALNRLKTAARELSLPNPTLFVVGREVRVDVPEGVKLLGLKDLKRVKQVKDGG